MADAFPFGFLAPDVPGATWDEQLVELDAEDRSSGGIVGIVVTAQDQLYRLRATVRLWTPAQMEQMEQFRRAKRRTGLFTIKGQRYRAREKAALGTGDGATTSFAFSAAGLERYLDAPTLKVFVNDVEEPGANWTLSGNETDPTITFNTAPGAFPITVSYDYLIPVRFSDPEAPGPAPDAGFADYLFRFEEFSAGARLA